APGMGHCGGGEGPNVFDKIGPLERWVEQGTAPNALIASHATDGKVDRTRPLCSYPQVAKYKGTGSVDDAANFACVASSRKGTLGRLDGLVDSADGLYRCDIAQVETNRIQPVIQIDGNCERFVRAPEMRLRQRDDLRPFGIRPSQRHQRFLLALCDR